MPWATLFQVIGRAVGEGPRPRCGELPAVSTLLALAQAIESRDPHSSGHAMRVGVMAEVVAARLGWDEEDVDVLRMGAVLHDIGKLAVPERILRKPGRLDGAGLAELGRHPGKGAGMAARPRPL